MNPRDLEKWSFYWSEVRLVVAAVALLLGGIPPVLYVLGAVPGLAGILGLGLKLAWVVSGAASLYLGYEWMNHGWLVFGAKDSMDRAAFAILTVSGLNLGVTGLLGINIGMSISSNYMIFVVVAVLYLWSAFYLWKRWGKHEHRLF